MDCDNNTIRKFRGDTYVRGLKIVIPQPEGLYEYEVSGGDSVEIVFLDMLEKEVTRKTCTVADGELSVEIPTSLAPGLYKYKIIIAMASGEVYTVTKSKIYVK